MTEDTQQVAMLKNLLAEARARVAALEEAGDGLADYIGTVVRSLSYNPDEEPGCLARWREVRGE